MREIWIKTRKIVGTAFLNYTQVFYTSRVGGSEVSWHLYGTSLKNFNFNPRVCFYVTSAWFVRAVARKQF